MERLFLTATLILIFFTVFIQGGTIKLLVNALKIKRKEDKDKSHIICDVNRKTVDFLMSGIESVAGHVSMSKYYSGFERFDSKWIRPFLLSKRALNHLTLRLEKITLDEHYAR